MTNKKKKILLVEDDYFLLKISKARLTEEDIDFDEASDGEDTLRHIKKYKYSLILLDIVMPKKNGIEVLKVMQEMGLKTPVIIFSNMTQGDIKHDMKGLEIKGYFLKASHTIEEMVNLIKTYLE